MTDVELARREGVELVRTGNWSAASGNWTPTRKDILSAVKATECPAVRRPRLKLGHFDARFNDGNGDGEPALGWFENLRAADGGHTLLGDQVALPWLNQVQAAAYPDRSIEGTYKMRCGLDHVHPFVITAVALLGVTPPAVSALKSIADLPEMLGVAAAVDDPGNGEHVSVTIHTEGVTAGAGKDRPRMSRAQRIRNAWNSSNPPATQWVQEARPDAAVVVDDADRSYRLYPVTFLGDDVVFGEPQAYDPETDRPLVFASRAESRPEEPTGGAPAVEPVPKISPPDEPAAPPLKPAVPDLPAAEPEQENPDPKEEDPVSTTDLSPIGSRLGLNGDISVDSIAEAIDALKAKAEAPPTVIEPTPELVAASAAAAERTAELEKTVEKLAGQLTSISTELAAAKQEKADTVKASVIQAAADLGKFTPADREQWEKDYDEAPGVTTRILASIAPGTAVPVMASGVTGPAEPAADDDLGFNEDSISEWATSIGIDPKELSRG